MIIHKAKQGISIIITCYKEGHLLSRAVESVLPQLNDSCELIIVNDSSPCEITNQLCNKFRANGVAQVIFHDVNCGLSKARNTGIEHAGNEIFMFLDADDILPLQAVSSILSGLNTYPEADFYFGNYLRTDLEDNNQILVNCSEISDSQGYLDPKRLISKWILSGHTACKKNTWKRAGKYKQLFSYDFQDVDFYMRVLAAGMKGKFIDGVLYHWMRSLNGMNQNAIENRLFFDAYNYQYYETLGENKQFWEKVIFKFLCDAKNQKTRSLARSLMWNLFPTKFSRINMYLKFLYHVCLPRASN